MYIKLNNGVPENYSIGQLRKDNVSTSFPRNITAEILSEYDVYELIYEPMPDITSTQKLEQNEFPTLVDGNWVIQWNVLDKTAEEIALDNDAQAASVRTQRDKLLAESDWVTVKAVDQNAQDSLGIQVPQVWLTYRQALRDITSHANFPNLQDTDWPETP